ncbi:MAG: hypothetical protein KC653_01225 [Candidatus Andersenbacteria bacterium]|nr:hypothetical protein [Candidatus Andersenbacteria bacterium]
MNVHTLQRRYQSWYRTFPKYSKASLKLHRMKRLLELLGRPERGMPTRIQIVGTNGKGSTTAFMESILSAAGYRVGVFSSPAFVTESEQIRLGTQFLEHEVFEEQLQLLKPYLDRVEAEFQERPTRFEVVNALMLLLFREWKVDVALFEAGLGGAFDATSAHTAQIVALTNVSLDHTHVLGDTIHAIASDKSQAAREGTRVVTTTAVGEARGILAERVRTLGLTLAEPRAAFSDSVSYEGTLAQISTPSKTYHDLELGLTGLHQVQNAALALTTLEEAARLGSLSISEAAIREGCATVVHPGRFQVVTPEQFAEPLPQPAHTVLDGAHNAEGMHVLLGTMLALHPAPPIAIFGTKNSSRDGFIELLKRSEHVYLPRIAFAPFFTHPERLKTFVPPIYKDRVTVTQTLQEALFMASRHAEDEARDLVITGSLYFLGVLFAAEPGLLPRSYRPETLPTLSAASLPSL